MKKLLFFTLYLNYEWGIHSIRGRQCMGFQRLKAVPRAKPEEQHEDVENHTLLTSYALKIIPSDQK